MEVLERGGVCGFFIISGFLSGYKNKHITHQSVIVEGICGVVNKIKKFYPLYFCFTVFAGVLMCRSWSDLIDFARCALLIQSYWGRADIALSCNWPTWFLSSILFSYLLDPFLRKHFSKDKKWNSLLLGFLLLVSLLWSSIWMRSPEPYGLGYYMVYIFPVARLLDYFLGLLTGKILRDMDCDVSGFVELVSFAILIGTMVIHTEMPFIFQLTVIWQPVFILIVLVFAKEGKYVHAISNNRLLLWVGERSFDLFIIHRLVLMVVNRFGDTVLMWCIGSILVAIIAEMSYQIEKYDSDVKTPSV